MATSILCKSFIGFFIIYQGVGLSLYTTKIGIAASDDRLRKVGAAEQTNKSLCVTKRVTWLLTPKGL